MMILPSEEVMKCLDEMEIAEKAGDKYTWKLLDKKLGDILEKEHEKEREEYLEVFGLDIDNYSDYSYKLLDLDYGRKTNATIAKAKETDEHGYTVYKILIYLYTRKDGLKFEKDVFEEQLLEGYDPSGDYVTGILRELSDNGFIENISFQHVEDETYRVASNLKKMKITAKGTDYLLYDPVMKKMQKIMRNGAGYITQLTDCLPKK